MLCDLGNFIGSNVFIVHFFFSLSVFRLRNKFTQNRNIAIIFGTGNTLIMHLCENKERGIRGHSSNTIVQERTGGVTILLQSGGSGTIHYIHYQTTPMFFIDCYHQKFNRHDLLFFILRYFVLYRM